MSNLDAEALISRLSGGLAPADREPFRQAAENALATAPECSGGGEGAIYRTITKIWRQYFHPPRDAQHETSWFQERKRHGNKLIDKTFSRG
jgi:hypothetical protein